MRNRIKTITKNQDDQVWIRIPTINVEKETIIKNVLIDYKQNWMQKHVKAFENNYGKNVQRINFINEIYTKRWKTLSDFNIEFISKCCKFLKINTKLIRASDLSVEGKKSKLVLNICKKFKASEYLANQGSRGYLEKDQGLFDAEGIKISYNEYTHKIYKQKGVNFVENLSILDLLFNELDNSKDYI